MSDLVEKPLASKIVFNGNLLNVFSDQVELPNGKKASREYIKHPGAVAIVPITKEGNIVLVRQYRYPIGKVLLEVPAGKLDKDELPDKCALRELEEETGYVANNLKKMASIYTTPGFTDEIIHLYRAEDLIFSKPSPDEDEFLDVETYTKEEIKEMIADGRINDAKSMLALLLAGI
ncbi:NUDIX hydrolase [Pelosinus propionicus]|uniref:ADP-ribose pyrophosphatase n=1 Tax=Pelosinus propionicus DSM 13327 TaxID=1123291 RepID=A0A1I4KRN8_9FIRM|nr:NUDIX hydrolase [Pelosinus propionicus]SFL81077.1 ADP-ribose pyrophosphatase [Pelosinus propionicus DSM 13327]